MICSSNVGTGKSPDLSDFHPCRSRQPLAIAPGKSFCPELRKGDIQQEQSIPRSRKNASLVNKEPEWSDERLSSKKKKKKKKKEKKARVPREWSSRQAACIDGWALYQQTNTPFTEPTQEPNSCSSNYFFHSSLCSFQNEKKRKRIKWLLSSPGTGRAELIAARRCTWLGGSENPLTWSTSVLVLRAEPVAKDFGLAPMSKLSGLFLRCSFLRGRQWERIRCAVQVDRPAVTEPFEGFTRLLHNFLSKKKKKNHWPIKNTRTVSLEENVSCRNMRQENWSCWQKDERASLFSASQTVRNKPGPGPDAPSLTQTLIIQSVYWAALLQTASQSKWLAGICRLLRSNHSCIDGRRKLTQASMCLVCLHSGVDGAHARSGFDSASYVLSDRKQTGHSLVFRFLSGLVPLFVG